MRPLARIVTFATVMAITQAGCAGAGWSRSRDPDVLERERAAAEAHARSVCQGVPPEDVAPGVSGLDIVRVAVLERPIRYGGNVVEGAAVTVRTLGRSFDSMSLIVRCRAARGAVTRDPADPFAVPGALVRVYRDDGDAVIVQIRSRTQDRALEIARRLSGPSPGRGGTDAPDAETWPAADPPDATQPPPPARPPAWVVPPIAGPDRPTWRP